MRERRPLTLDSVPEELLAEVGVVRGSAKQINFRCTDNQAVLIPLADIDYSRSRKLNRDVLTCLLKGMRDHSDFVAVIVVRKPGTNRFVLLDGMHRVRASDAMGFISIPCKIVSLEEAIDAFGFIQ